MKNNDFSIAVPQVLYRGRRYWYHGSWKTWYEPCPVVKSTAKFLTVRSQTFEGSPLYKGGDFRLSQDILSSGKEYHSRHGEYFFLESGADGFLFPSKDLMETPDFATMEALQKGWGESRSEWEQWQRDCWTLALVTKKPLQSAIDAWKYGGDSGLERLWEQFRKEHFRLLNPFMRSTLD